MTSPFLITGQGRSGTLFLSRVLNLSPTWTVEHERLGDEAFFKNQAIVELALQRFTPKTGHVNSMFRRIAPELMERGIPCYAIVRDPRDICRSVHAGHGRTRDEFQRTVNEIIPGLAFTIAIAYSGGFFRFERMISDVRYLQEIAASVGIDDIDWGLVDMVEKVNASPAGSLPHWREWTDDEGWYFDARLGWFMRGMGYGW